MDFDLEILSEDGDHPDPLFDSIMNAMNSMKEATADKIYQKIQKEGATNYSKPQVDRALASALKYGIFEVKNNRYRVRDDILDDEDTVYWKLQKKRAQSPFHIPETASRQNGQRLDPESDNQRFRRPRNVQNKECPHCGRTKRPTINESARKGRRVRRRSIKNRKSNSKVRRRKSNTSEHQVNRRTKRKRKVQLDLHSEGRSSKRRKRSGPKRDDILLANLSGQEYYSDEDFLDDLRLDRNLLQGAYNMSDSKMKLLLTSDHSIKSNSGVKSDFNKKNKHPSPQYVPEFSAEDVKIVKSKRSSTSLKSESDSEKTCATSASDDLSQSRTADGFFESQVPNTHSGSDKVKSQCMNSNETYEGLYERDEMGQSKGDSDWLECSDEPQGTIIESNNVLTIKPIDSLAFKSPEQATYIS